MSDEKLMTAIMIAMTPFITIAILLCLIFWLLTWLLNLATLGWFYEWYDKKLDIGAVGEATNEGDYK